MMKMDKHLLLRRKARANQTHVTLDYIQDLDNSFTFVLRKNLPNGKTLGSFLTVKVLVQYLGYSLTS